MPKFKQQIDEKTAALTLGLVASILTIISEIAFAIGGQNLSNWIINVHGFSAQVTVNAFDPLTAVINIVYHFIVGSIIGWIFAVVWNQIAKRK